MNNNAHELQVVQAFSALTIPEQIVRDSNIRELIKDMIADTSLVKDESQRLKELRQEKKDGNFISNWWNDWDSPDYTDTSAKHIVDFQIVLGSCSQWSNVCVSGCRTFQYSQRHQRATHLGCDSLFC